MGRAFVFCSVNKSDNLGVDKPISGTDVYRVVKVTEEECGIAFKPHDLRRTFNTETLATNTPLVIVQTAAGHACGETTLRYAPAVDARQAREALNLQYWYYTTVSSNSAAGMGSGPCSMVDICLRRRPDPTDVSAWLLVAPTLATVAGALIDAADRSLFFRSHQPRIFCLLRIQKVYGREYTDPYSFS